MAKTKVELEAEIEELKQQIAEKGRRRLMLRKRKIETRLQRAFAECMSHTSRLGFQRNRPGN